MKYLGMLLVMIFLSACAKIADEGYPAALEFKNEASLIEAIKEASENPVLMIADSSSGDESYHREFDNMTEFYRPIHVIDDLEFHSIAITNAYVAYIYHHGDKPISFTWFKPLTTEVFIESALQRGGSQGSNEIVEHNGIQYIFYGYKNLETGDIDDYSISWVQYDKCFKVFIPANYSMEEILSFCDAEPVVVSEYIEQLTSEEGQTGLRGDETDKLPNRVKIQ